jgi:hypothetical protein
VMKIWLWHRLSTLKFSTTFGGHKAFPQPKLCEMYFYEYRFELQDYLPSI